MGAAGRTNMYASAPANSDQESDESSIDDDSSNDGGLGFELDQLC